MPVSSFTCTGSGRSPAAPASTGRNSGSQRTTSARASTATADIGGGQRSHHEHPAVDLRLPEPIRFSGRGHGQPGSPAGERRPGALLHPVAVGIGLDHRAEGRVADKAGRQLLAVGSHGIEIDAGQRPLRLAHRTLPNAAGSASITSPATVWSAPVRAAASMPARA